MRNLHQVPGLFQRARLFNSDMKHVDGPAALPGQHHRARFGDVAWPTGAIDGEGGIETFFQPACHDRQSAQTSTGGTALRRPETEVLDHAPGPLAIEVGGVHHDRAPVAPVPSGGNDAAMPKG